MILVSSLTLLTFIGLDDESLLTLRTGGARGRAPLGGGEFISSLVELWVPMRGDACGFLRLQEIAGLVPEVARRTRRVASAAVSSGKTW